MRLHLAKCDDYFLRVWRFYAVHVTFPNKNVCVCLENLVIYLLCTCICLLVCEC